MIALHDNSPAVVVPGIYPMLYAFFDDHGVLRQDPFRRQVDAALGTQAAGVAILGLGTEVSKLTFDERVEVLEVVAKRIDGCKPLLVTVYGDTITEQIEFSKRAIQSGASALMLQPHRRKWTMQSWRASSPRLSRRSIARLGFRMRRNSLASD